jgi:hypothetical protein
VMAGLPLKERKEPRTTPTIGGITIVGGVPSERAKEVQVTVTSSV